MLQRLTLYLHHFVRVQVYFQDTFPEVKLLGRKVCAFLILMDVAKWLSLGVLPICSPTSNVRESAFGEGLGSVDEWSRGL